MLKIVISSGLYDNVIPERQTAMTANINHVRHILYSMQELEQCLLDVILVKAGQCIGHHHLGQGHALIARWNIEHLLGDGLFHNIK